MPYLPLLLALACGYKAPPLPPEPREDVRSTALPAAARTEASAGVRDDRLAALLERHWEHRLADDPLGATELGAHQYDALLHDPSPEATQRARARDRSLLAELTAVQPALTDPGDALSAAILREMMEADAAMAACESNTWYVSARSTPLVWLSRLPELHDATDPAGGQALASRLGAAAATIDGEIASLRAGLAAGRVADVVSVQRAIRQLDGALADPELLAWARPFSGREPTVAALRRYRDVLDGEIRPSARDGAHVGASGLPDGQACYRAAIRYHTTLPLTADEVAAAGHAELAALHAEIRAIGLREFGTDDLQAIFARLRDDPSLRFGSAEEIEAFALERLRRAEAAVPAVFARLPVTPCEVRPIPPLEAPWTYVAYYKPPEPGREPGYYYVNTHEPTTRLRHEAAALAFHEAVPGHHTQIALAQELGDVPAFRRHAYITAYAEGWALYAERLADELGLYDDDRERLGMLSYATWRASRLVVDAGLHAQGWTRAEAIAFMTQNTALAANNIENEVDRYVTWPGQALGYQVGQLELRRLRSEAEAALGPRFTRAGFHAAVLDAGPLPLPLLGARVREWINKEGS
jgi:uncharacterized protein (DUF885 family)